MAIFLHVSNLIVLKSSLEKKYKGGINQFKKDFNFYSQSRNQEDNYILSFSALNSEDFDLSFSNQLNQEDYVVLNREGGFSWEVNWFINSNDYAWHINQSEKISQEVGDLDGISIEDFLYKYKTPMNFLKMINS